MISIFDFLYIMMIYAWVPCGVSPHDVYDCDLWELLDSWISATFFSLSLVNALSHFLLRMVQSSDGTYDDLVNICKMILLNKL